ncbi:hypothetical protein Q2T40_04955 [Winogradskyella maritima]|nr:hypothetical protein [Winogradskyella maritima]
MNSSLSELELYYQTIRDFRNGKNIIVSRNKVFQEVQEKFSTDWPIPIEIYELAIKSGDKQLAQKIKVHLEPLKLEQPKLGQLIDDGLALASNTMVATV